MKISDVLLKVESYVSLHKSALLHAAGYVAVYIAGAHHLAKVVLKAILTHVK